MYKRLLILGATIDHCRHFARNNQLAPSKYTVVTSPQHLKGYQGETILIILNGWTTHRNFHECEKFQEELFWFTKRNDIKHMNDDEILEEK